MYFGIHRSIHKIWCESTSSVGRKCLDAVYRIKEKSNHACHYSEISNVSWWVFYFNDFDIDLPGKRQIFGLQHAMYMCKLNLHLPAHDHAAFSLKTNLIVISLRLTPRNHFISIAWGEFIA